MIPNHLLCLLSSLRSGDLLSSCLFLSLSLPLLWSFDRDLLLEYFFCGTGAFFGGLLFLSFLLFFLSSSLLSDEMLLASEEESDELESDDEDEDWAFFVSSSLFFWISINNSWCNFSSSPASESVPLLLSLSGRRVDRFLSPSWILGPLGPASNLYSCFNSGFLWMVVREGR